MMRYPLAVFAAFLCTATVARAADKPKILVVNLQRLIDESEEGKRFIKKLQNEVADKKEAMKKEVMVLQERQRDLMKVESSNRTPKWYEDVRDLFERIAGIKAKEQYFIAKKNDDIARAVTQLVQGARTEARTIMSKRGAWMVLISRTGPLNINSEAGLKEEISQRRVLCAVPQIDITDEVLKAMNKWFRENRSESDKGGKGANK